MNSHPLLTHLCNTSYSRGKNLRKIEIYKTNTVHKKRQYLLKHFEISTTHLTDP